MISRHGLAVHSAQTGSQVSAREPPEASGTHLIRAGPALGAPPRNSRARAPPPPPPHPPRRTGTGKGGGAGRVMGAPQSLPPKCRGGSPQEACAQNPSHVARILGAARTKPSEAHTIWKPNCSLQCQLQGQPERSPTKPTRSPPTISQPTILSRSSEREAKVKPTRNPRAELMPATAVSRNSAREAYTKPTRSPRIESQPATTNARNSASEAHAKPTRSPHEAQAQNRSPPAPPKPPRLEFPDFEVMISRSRFRGPDFEVPISRS